MYPGTDTTRGCEAIAAIAASVKYSMTNDWSKYDTDTKVAAWAKSDEPRAPTPVAAQADAEHGRT